MTRILFALVAVCLFAGCSGTHSTIRDGFAYRIPRTQVHGLLDSTLRAHVASDRMLPSSELVVSGYSRVLTDTQTYTLSAIPVSASDTYGLEVSHRGTMFNGPATARKIYKDAVRRADLLGTRIPVR